MRAQEPSQRTSMHSSANCDCLPSRLTWLARRCIGSDRCCQVCYRSKEGGSKKGPSICKRLVPNGRGNSRALRGFGKGRRPSEGKEDQCYSEQPFFERWLLLHFEKVATPFKTDTDLQNVLKRVRPAFKETRMGFGSLYPLIGTAIKHAEEVLRETECGDDLRNHNPSTHVHLLVKHLGQIAHVPCAFTP